VGRELRILLVAEDSAGVQTLRALGRTDHRVVAVMASPPDPTARHATVAGVAAAAGYDLWPAAEVADPGTADRIRAADVDLLINVHSLFIIHADVLRAPRIGAFNLHPGPLPGYAGLNTPSWAISRGEARHGVTVHWMTAGIDTGPVAYAEDFPIGAEDTGLGVSATCVRRGVPLVMRLVDAAAGDPSSIPAIAQDPAARRYFHSGPPHDGTLSWDAPARAVADLVRACDYSPLTSPWGSPTGRLGSVDAAIVSASRTGRPSEAPPGTIGEVSDLGVEVACADEWVLVRRCQMDGRSVPAHTLLGA